MHRLIIVIVSLFFGLSTYAQTVDDAVFMSTRDYFGTARGVGTAGSMSALGGDFGSISRNPAATASFHLSEINLTPAFFIGPSNSRVLDGEMGQNNQNRSDFMFGSVGYVQMNQMRRNINSHTNFAVGLNRLADFNQKFAFRDRGTGSITQFFVEQSNGINPDDLNAFTAGPAYDAYITSVDPSTLDYASDLSSNAVVNKRELVDQWGGIDELFIAYGVNFNQKLQLGGGLYLPFYRLVRQKRYTESANDQVLFRQVDFNQDLEVSGAGAGIKLGLNFSPVRWLHIGGAVHTPSVLILTEEFSTTARYDYIYDPDIFPSPGPAQASSPDGSFEYEFRMPWRFLGNVGFLIGQYGFITSEVEWVNYSSGEFTIADDTGFEQDLNRRIDNELGSVMTVRVGAEARLDTWRLRAGLALSENNIYLQDEGMDLSSVSAGLGKWVNRFFFDLGLRHEQFNQYYQPFTLQTGANTIVDSEITRWHIVLTVGCKIGG